MILRYEIKVLRFDENSFFNTVLGFSTNWDYKNPIGRGDLYHSEKNRNLSLIKKIHLNCDCVDGSVLNGVRQPILYSFVLKKPPRTKFFSEPETTHYKKLNKSVLKTITFYLKDENNEEVF